MKKLYTLLSIVNFLGLIYLLSLSRFPQVDSNGSILSDSSSIALFLSAQANQFALLQVLLSVLGISLAIAAFWGYMEITARAEQKAENTVKEEVPKLFEEMLAKFGREELQRMLLETKTDDSRQENIPDVKNENLAKMYMDPLDMEIVNEYQN